MQNLNPMLCFTRRSATQGGWLSVARQVQAAPRGQRGFTLVEVLVALVIFAISVVGLVALEGRSIDAQVAAAQLREGERIAQQEVADLSAKGYLELVARDFAGNNNPSFPYDDSSVDAAERLRDFRRPPADIPAAERVLGEVRGRYIAYRRVDWIVDPLAPPTNPPTDDELVLVTGLELEVVVLWIDDTNPNFPPPASLRTADLTPQMADPTNAAFSPYIGQVRLRTVRVNDATLDAP